MTNLRFREDSSFRVPQMADIQDGPNVLPDTIRPIREAIRKADPDLVVSTSDQTRGYDPTYTSIFPYHCGGEPGARMCAATEAEAKLYGIKRWAGNRVNNRLPAMKSDGSNPDAQQAALTASTTSVLVYSTISDLQGVPAILGELMDETRDKAHRTFAGFLGPVIEVEVSFTVIYGNHDLRCGILADEQDGICREFPGRLNPVGSLGLGISALPIETSGGFGRVVMPITVVNSGDYAGKPEENDAQYPTYMANLYSLDLADSDGYGVPSPEVIDWLGAVQSKLGKRNGNDKPVPAIAFQHIPLWEFYNCPKEVPVWTPNMVGGTRTHAGHYYVLSHEVCRSGLRLGEMTGCADENAGEVGVLREAGGYFALLCSHDHKNAPVGHAYGIDSGYAPTRGFECYDPKSRYRGIRLSEFHESNLVGYVTCMLTWGDLVGRHSSNKVRVWSGDHCVTGVISMCNELRRLQVFTALVGAMSLGFMVVTRSLVKKR